ncbi:MAG: Pycsar system effector family protein [Candidatus Saccharimonadales bacterium]
MTTEQLETSLNRVHEWIRAADQKASIFLALVLGGLALGGNEFLGYLSTIFNDKPVWLATVLMLSTVILVWSITEALFIIKPSVANNAKSFTYFGHISQISLSEYRTIVTEVSNIKYKDELIEQIHTSSKIARKKHEQLAEAVKLFCLYVLVMAAIIGLSYVT